MPTRPRNGSRPRVSVVIATLDRQASLVRLLRQLACQTIPADQFEVVVVDDGSSTSVASALGPEYPWVTVFRTERVGAAAARNYGIRRASGEIIVVVDDDVQVEPDFLQCHAELHPPGSRNAVLGWIRPDPSLKMPLFERFHADILERFADAARHNRIELQGTHVATGNVSFRRADYAAVGGFDPSLKHSEDAEFGVRLQKSGVSLRFSDRAFVLHSSDRANLDAWLSRAFVYGICDLQISTRHPDVMSANPWRYVWLVNPLSRPLLALAVVAPPLMHVAARVGIELARAVDELGAERLAISATTLVYGLEYFRGVRHESGSLRHALTAWWRYARMRRQGQLQAAAGHAS
jgi:GT2 family glycosyltransferase